MFNFRTKLMLRVIPYLLAPVLVLSMPGRIRAQTSENEKAVWTLEHNYWRFVEANDLTAYRNLWHKNFLGWPSVSSSPARKDHITDWITSQTAQGFTFKPGEFREAGIQVTGDLVVACYWMTYEWKDKDGNAGPHTIRVIHTWIKDGADWRIIGGMSMPVPAAPPK